MPRLTLFAVASMLSISACQSATSSGGAVTDALCEAWGETLPTWSGADSEQTAREIDRAIRTHEAACEG